MPPLGQLTRNVNTNNFTVRIVALSCATSVGFQTRLGTSATPSAVRPSQLIASGSLTSYLDQYPIERWDSSTIQFQNNAPACVTYIYVIDRATEKLSGRRLKKPDADKQLCNDVIQFDDLRLSFANGFDVVQGLQQENAPTVASVVIGTGFIILMLAWIWKVIRRKPEALGVAK